MKKTTKESKIQGRIVNVSSMGHRFTYPKGILFDKINDPPRYQLLRIYVSRFNLCQSLSYDN